MLKDVIVDSIKSYMYGMKYMSITVLPLMIYIGLFVYILFLIQMYIDEYIFMLLLIIGLLLLVLVGWVWLNIFNYLDENDKI